MAKTEDAARQAAVQLLQGVGQGISLSDQPGRLARLQAPDRARAQRLAVQVLRHTDRADAVLAQFMTRRPRPQVLEILRLATVEMLALGAAPHGAVNAAVGLTRRMGPKGQAASGMVNAVLRKVAGFQGWDDMPPQRLPDWLRAACLAAWGPDATRAIEAAHQAGAALDLTAKPGVSAPGDPLPTGSFRIRESVQVSALPGFDAGDWWVQDAAAALPVALLAPQPGERITDLCAAPGGKTMQMAAAGAQVTAVDLSAPRMERLAENLARCGLSAQMITADALDYRPDDAPDAILLDAPCSATGTIRRHPELPYLRDGEAVADLAALQVRLLDHAIDILKPGGRLVFATCSLLPAEGEEQIRALLERHPALCVQQPEVAGVDAAWRTPLGLRLRPDYWPDLGGMDGFFIARLHKPG